MQRLVNSGAVSRMTAAAAIDAANVSTERADVFYAALGERLAGIGPRIDADAVHDLRILLDRCMEVGPRGEDAALLLVSKRLNVLLDPENADVVAYIAKLRKRAKAAAEPFTTAPARACSGKGRAPLTVQNGRAVAKHVNDRLGREPTFAVSNQTA